MNKTPDSNGASRGLYLQWEGKKVYRQQVPTPRLFDPVEKYSHGEIRDNLLIEGDNLQVLASLKPRYAGMIDVIYIDPPYNLGKDDFRYSDKRFHDPDADDSDAVYVSNEDGGRHTKWLNSIAPRLYMMWQLLHDDRGVMFISINDVELFRLGMLLNEIFGEENWVGTIVWRSNTDNNPTRIAMEHEYILCYAKSKDRLRPRWTNPDSEMKAMLLDAFERLQTETKSTAALTKAFAHFTKENKDALGDLYRYRRIDEHGPYASAADEELQHTKAVEWTHEVERDSLTAGTKNSLGSIATIFCISDEAAQEIHARLDGVVTSSGDERVVQTSSNVEAVEVGEADLRRDIEQRALEFLQDRIVRLEWDEMQELVAGLLRAMGYKTHVAAPGADRGRDITASPDGFGFQEPRILVEVKHRKGTIGAPEIRAFLGGLRQKDNGLYVSTGGFTREARYEAERANHHLALLDLDGIGKSVMEHYDGMDAETRALLPLKKIYWPA